MFLVDANVLIYAVDSSSLRHEPARQWLLGALNDPTATVAIPWVSLLAFVRITTRAGLFQQPLTTAEAMAYVDGWLACPNVVAVEPTVRHADLLRGLLLHAGGAGNLVTDAQLAALCLEYGATMVSFDGDMSRFGIPTLRPS